MREDVRCEGTRLARSAKRKWDEIKEGKERGKEERRQDGKSCMLILVAETQDDDMTSLP